MSIAKETASGSENTQLKEKQVMEGTESQLATQSRNYRLRWWTLGVLSISLLVVALDVTVLNVALPTFQRELGASAAGMQWIVNAYILVFAGLLLTIGSLGDRFGRRRSLEIGLIIFGISSLAAAYAGTTGQLIATRAFMGVGGALIMPSTLSVLVNVFPREERAKAIGIWAAVAALGIPLGMVLGGWLLETFWWGSVFLINVPVAVAAVIAGRVVVPESKDPAARRIDIPGAVLSIATLSVLVYSFIEAPERGWLDPLILSGFAGALVLAVIFVAYELRTHQPMLDIRFFKNPRLSAGAGAVALAFMAMLATMFILTQYLQFVRGYTPLETGLRFAPLALGFMIGAPTSAVLVGKLGTRRVASGGLVIVAAAIGGLAFIDGQTAYWMVGLALVALGVGMANTMAPATDAVMAALPEAQAGVGSALNDTTRQVGGALGIGIFGSLFNSVYSSGVANAVVGLPAEAAAAARNSIGAAGEIAADLGNSVGDSLLVSANGASVDALAVTFIATAVLALIGSALVFWFMPAHDVVRTTEEVRSDEMPITGDPVPAPVPVRLDE